MITLLFALSAPAFAQAPPLGEPPSPELVQKLLSRESELLEVVRRNDPEQYERLMHLRDSDRGAYLMALMRIGRMVERAKDDPELAARFEAIRAKTEELHRAAEDFSALSASEQKAKRKELEALAGELMDLKQAERRARLEELRVRLAELEAEIDEREKDRARIVDEYVDQLLREKVDL